MSRESGEDKIRVNSVQIDYITDRLAELLFSSFIFSEPMKNGDLDTSLYRMFDNQITGSRLTNSDGEFKTVDSPNPLKDFVEDLYQVLMGSKTLRSREIYPSPFYQTDNSYKTTFDYIEFIRGKITELFDENKSNDGTLALCDLLKLIENLQPFEISEREDISK